MTVTTSTLTVRRWREKNKSRGLCACGADPKPGGKVCQACIDQALRARARNAEVRDWCLECFSFKHRGGCPRRW